MARPVKLRSDLGVRVPSGQAPVHPEAGSGGGQRCLTLSGATEAFERRERIHSPQHKVKSAASSDYQPKGDREGRAAHVTVKARDRRPSAGGTLDLPGVWEAGWGEGAMRDRRDPSAQPRRQGGSYKPMAKSGAVQRESEGGHSTDDGRGTELGRREGPLLWPSVRRG